MNTANQSTQRAPLPPFTHQTTTEKVRLAENGWNGRDPEKVALAYTVDSWWRNRAEFVQGRPAIIEFLTRKWRRELDYRLIKELWAFGGTGSPCDSLTSGMTTPATGFVPMAMRTGNLIPTG